MINSHTSTRPSVSVCACTFKRPHLLRTLLESLAQQTFPTSDFEVVIVDNDPLGSGKSAIDEARHRFPKLALRYAIETNSGISFARNRSVEIACGKLIAFIDDDESANPVWLEELVECMSGHGADAVMGPILPSFPEGTPDWVVKTGFFQRKRFATGIPLTWGDGHTGNALVNAEWIRKRKPAAFDIALARSGGEDTDFFRWISESGGKLTWCDSAVVHEIVPCERQSVRFMLKRSLVSSVTYWRPKYERHGLLWRYWQAGLGLAKCAFCCIGGTIKLPFGFGSAVATWSEGAKAFGRVVAMSKANVVGYGK